ncbi:hypothetical protein AB0L41_39440 [Amycolatopsis mediterranei]|uniref:hypothetical protein n=1 Tax=Amycolatopsis mediterranei TaxID=33910 RepID=UPI00341CF2DB
MNCDECLALFVENPARAVTCLAGRLDPPPSDKQVLCAAAVVLEVLWADAVERQQFLALSALARLRFLATSVAIHQSYQGWLPTFRSARVHWLGYLDDIDRDPWLSGRNSTDIEGDLALMRQALLHEGDTDDHTWRFYDRALARRLVDNHLLPRGDLRDSVELVAHYDRRTTTSTLVPWLVLLVPVIATVLLGALWCIPLIPGRPPWLGFVGDVVCVVPAIVAVATLRATEHNPLRTRLLLPRVLAANVVGIAALVTLHPDWWQTPVDGLSAIVTPILLAAAAFVYQLHEFRNHGSTGCALVCRTLLVTLISLCYALLVNWLALRYVLPAFSEEGHLLATSRSAAPMADLVLPADPASPGAAPHIVRPLWMLLTATAWSHSLAVFIQLVWDDKPITAPLGRQPRG